VPGNLPRVLPSGTRARVSHARPWPPLFELLARGGPVEDAEMRRTFNLGVGLIAVVDAARAEAAERALTAAGERAHRFGEVLPADAAREPDVEFV
jgi:phosphoribosylformylglycinamidine cyclo-ligase